MPVNFVPLFPSELPLHQPSQKLPACFVPNIPRPFSTLFLGFSLLLTLACLATICSAAQCKIPRHFAQFFVEIVAQRGESHPFALFFMWYRASIAEIPLLWGVGYRTSTSHAPIGHVERPKTHSAQKRAIAEIVSQYRAIRGH